MWYRVLRNKSPRPTSPFESMLLVEHSPAARRAAAWPPGRAPLTRNIEHLGSGEYLKIYSGAFFRKFEVSLFHGSIMVDASGPPTVRSAPETDDHNRALASWLWCGAHGTHSGGFYFAKGGLEQDRILICTRRTWCAAVKFKSGCASPASEPTPHSCACILTRQTLNLSRLHGRQPDSSWGLLLRRMGSGNVGGLATTVHPLNAHPIFYTTAATAVRQHPIFYTTAATAVLF